MRHGPDSFAEMGKIPQSHFCRIDAHVGSRWRGRPLRGDWTRAKQSLDEGQAGNPALVRSVLEGVRGRTMTTFAYRLLGAARLDARTYEEVEADRRATFQAVAIVLLASASGGIGLLGLDTPNPRFLVTQMVGALIAWLAWASLTCLIGTRLLPEPQTRADVGQLLRTLAFASAPGVLRVLGVVPTVGFTIYVIASIWMLVAMVVAVRQALDFTSTGRAVGVCVVGWAMSIAIAAILGNVFAPIVSYIRCQMTLEDFGKQPTLSCADAHAEAISQPALEPSRRVLPAPPTLVPWVRTSSCSAFVRNGRELRRRNQSESRSRSTPQTSRAVHAVIAPVIAATRGQLVARRLHLPRWTDRATRCIGESCGNGRPALEEASWPRSPNDPQFPLFPGVNARVRSHHRIVYCAVCRAKEARYGFRDKNRPDPPSTFCFECFCREIEKRQRWWLCRANPGTTCGEFRLGEK